MACAMNIIITTITTTPAAAVTTIKDAKMKKVENDKLLLTKPEIFY